MSKFNLEDLDSCTKMFESGKSSKEVQDYLMNKYSLVKRSYTSNFVKVVRKKMGIYIKKVNKF